MTFGLQGLHKLTFALCQVGFFKMDPAEAMGGSDHDYCVRKVWVFDVETGKWAMEHKWMKKNGRVLNPPKSVLEEKVRCVKTNKYVRRGIVKPTKSFADIVRRPPKEYKLTPSELAYVYNC